MNIVLAQSTKQAGPADVVDSSERAVLAARQAEVAAEKARLAAEKAELAVEKLKLAAEKTETPAANTGTPAGAEGAPATTTAAPVPKSEVPTETAEAITEGVTKTLAPVLDHLETIYAIFAFRVFSYQGLAQLVFVVVLGLACWFLQRPAVKLFDRTWVENSKSKTQIVRATFRSLVWPILFLLTLWIALPGAAQLGYGNQVIRIATSLLTAWIFIRLISSAIRDPLWSRTIALIIWVIAALNILRLLNPTIALLDSIAITIGDSRFSIYLMIKGGLIALFMLWFASVVSQVLQGRLRKAKSLTPSVKALISQLSRFGLLFLAFIVVLNSVGIDLTALAVLSGAIGVGIGFGLQKIVSNLISGIILLSDKSIKPGDVIDVGGVIGWVSGLGARYTAVRTRDGTEHLIPNEELIINQVVNWSHSDKVVRRKVPIGVHYDGDLFLAKKLIFEALAETPRILTDPAPNVLTRGFGDSSVDLEARFWINDPEAGLSNVAGELLENVWVKFKDNGVEIPYPQRDLHLRSAIPVNIEMPGRVKTA